MRLPSAFNRAPGCPHRQRGAAIISVLVVVTIATLLVASLFWRQHLGARSVLNRQAMAQLRWIETAVLDWAAVVLRADQSSSGQVDHLQETWAVPVAETRLDETVTAGARIAGDTRSALIAGQIFDAQSRLNLSNLVHDGKPVARQVQAYRRLLAQMGLPPELEAPLTERLLLAYPPTPPASLPPPLKLRDLLRIPGYDERAVALLTPYVILIPKRVSVQGAATPTASTRVNINTATPEVLAALVDDLSIDAARNLVLLRERIVFSSLDQASSRLNPPVAFNSDYFSVGSDFFLLFGMVRFERIEASSEALFFRGPTRVELVWRQQF
jgi:general secretion pathway protein K